MPVRAGVRFFFGGEARVVPSLGAGYARGSLHADVAAAFDRPNALGTALGASVGASF